MNSSESMDQKLKVGIAGYGVVGKKRRHFIDQHPHLKTVAICDTRFKKSPHVEENIKSFSTYQELLNEDLDIVFVCLTNEIAAEVTCAALQKKRHVFCEKPPGRDLNDIANVIIEERKDSSLKLMYGFNHRYHDSVKQAFEIVKEGSLGKIINLRAVYGKSKIISFESDWRTKRMFAGGGILLDQGIHMVDLIRMFVGDFEQIHSFVDNSFWNHDVEDNAYALMKTKNGVVAFLHSTATQWRHRFHLDISMEKGSITLSGILSGTKSYGAETITIATKSEEDGGDPEEKTIRYNKDNSWKEEIEYFAHCILNKKKVEQGSSTDAYKTMKLVYKIYCADASWKEKFKLSDKPLKDFQL